MYHLQRKKARLVMKRIPNIFAYVETRTRDLTVPSISKERISTVAKPQLKVAVIIMEFLALYTNLYTQNSGKNTPNTIGSGKIRVGTKMLLCTVSYSN
jgi:hypothetical protein